MITLTSLSKVYRTNEIETVALENVNLTVDRGEFLSIMGPSRLWEIYITEYYGLLVHRLPVRSRSTVPYRRDESKELALSATRLWDLCFSLSI